MLNGAGAALLPDRSFAYEHCCPLFHGRTCTTRPSIIWFAPSYGLNLELAIAIEWHIGDGTITLHCSIGQKGTVDEVIGESPLRDRDPGKALMDVARHCIPNHPSLLLQGAQTHPRIKESSVE